MPDPDPDPAPSAAGPPVREVLAAAVAALGGQERPGQVQMAEAVAEAMQSGEHLLVQAGTGTGKSLAYLVPALLHPERVVIATATLALQHQLVERDIPALVAAVRTLLPQRDASFAVLKGRANYACLHRAREGVPDEQGTLVTAPAGTLGGEVVQLREWAEKEATGEGTGERDRAPRHTERAWRQVSVNHRECLGATACPYGVECFAERARDRAHRSRVVVTNHSLLAIDAVEGVPMIPDYDVVVVDEAHELVARVTQAATDELTAGDVERAGKRAARHLARESEDRNPADDLLDAGEALAEALAGCAPGRIDTIPERLAEALALVRDAARGCVSAFPREAPGGGPGGPDGGPDAARVQAKAWCQEVFVTAERMAAADGEASSSRPDVLWLAEPRDRAPARLHVAPLEVAGPMRHKLLSDKTVVFTSATLRLGGDFGPVAAGFGLRPDDDEHPWQGLDVGSPFDYRRQAILYVARHLPTPGRDGLASATLEELCSLVDAAGGRTLGLFSSRRAAETAAEVVRKRLPHLTVLAQGDAQLPELTAQFVGDPHTCLFGTLSLWQGLDVPGETCQLVVIDRIPFPRPDDPLMSARQRAVDRAGGNGFMTVAAAHAALLLAQGSGRLIRTSTDRGVVAVLDPRLATARYAGFLRASLPPMWPTTDPAVAHAALRRLAAPAAAATTRTGQAPAGRTSPLS